MVNQEGTIAWRDTAVLDEHFTLAELQQRKRLLDQFTVEYYWECRQEGSKISGSAIRSKAKFFADALGIVDFAASDGWLRAFYRRHNIVFPRKPRTKVEKKNNPVVDKRFATLCAQCAVYAGCVVSLVVISFFGW